MDSQMEAQFGELCIKALHEAEKLQLKTNVLGLNISLNEDFPPIYSNIKKSFTQEASRCRAQTKEFIETVENALKLTHLQSLRSHNALVYEMRKRHQLDGQEAHLRVVPYLKYEAEKRDVEDKLLAFRRMSAEEKRLNYQPFCEQVSRILSAMGKDEKETYAGFAEMPDDAYRIQDKPSLSAEYWALMGRYRVQLQ